MEWSQQDHSAVTLARLTESDHSDEMELNKDTSTEGKMSSVSKGGGPKRKMRSHENVTNTGMKNEAEMSVVLFCDVFKT
jgi:hypothetical protein